MPATKRLRFRELALVDLEAATQWYAQHAGERAALGFLDALDAAFAHIERHPASGSPRWGHALDLPDLRSWPLGRFPHLVFYVGARGPCRSVARAARRARYPGSLRRAGTTA
jgi:toxin ParE1/3/4